MLLFVLCFFLAFAEEPSSLQADIQARQVTIPNLVAQKAVIDVGIEQAESYAVNGDFHRSFPQFADKPMLSSGYLLSVLSALQSKEVSLNVDKITEQCLGCSEDIKEEVQQYSKDLLDAEFRYIDIQRRFILSLYARVIDPNSLQHQKMMTYIEWWQDHFIELEKKLESITDQQSKDYQSLQEELNITGAQLAHFNKIQRYAVESLTTDDHDVLETWFDELFQQYKETDIFLEQRAAYELTLVYAFLSSGTESKQLDAIDEIKNLYESSVLSKQSDYTATLDALRDIPPAERLKRVKKLKEKCVQEQKAYGWLEEDLNPILENISTLMGETEAAIERVEQLSQAEHQEEVLLAEQELEAARRQLQQEEEKVEAQIQDGIVQVRELIQQLRESDQEVRGWVHSKLEEYDEQKESYEEALEQALQLSTLSRDRQEQLDSIYLQTDSQIGQIRLDIQEQASRTFANLELPQFDSSEIDPVLYKESLSGLKEAEQDYLQAISDSVLSRKEEEESIFRRLEGFKLLRRKIKPHSSDKALSSGRVDFWAELRFEFQEIPMQTMFLGLDIYDKLVNAPKQITRFDVLGRILNWLLSSVAFIVLWAVLRQYSGRIVQRIVLYVQDVGWKWDQKYKMTEEDTWVSPFVIDTLFLLGLYFGWHTSHPLVALIVLLGLGSFLWRWRKLLQKQEQSMLSKFNQTLFTIIIYVYSYLFLYDISIVIMSSDRISELVYFIFWASSIPFGVWILWDWSEVSEKHTAKWVEEHRFIRWFNKHLSSQFLKKVLWSFVGICMLVYQAFIFSSLLLIESTGWFGKSLSSTENTFTQDSSSMEHAERVFSQLENLYQLKDEQDLLNQHIRTWAETKNNGVIAIIGDRGTGKTTLLNQVKFLEHERLVISPAERMRNASMLRHWLADALGCSDPDNIVQDALKTKSKIIVVDRINFLFLRSMHGYNGLYELSRIMQQTAHHHCWIVSIHLHTWNFLSSKAVPFKTDVFYSAIQIGAISVQKCLTWSHLCAEVHNVNVDFSKLNKRYRTEYFLKQAEKSYWRLLVDTSIQNPSTIRRLWLNSLEYSQESNTFYVHFFESPSMTELERLPLTEQFILSSILIHGDMTTIEQSESLNIDFAEINHCCNSLENKGILHYVDGLYRISYRWYPSVILFLQQKHMLVAS